MACDPQTLVNNARCIQCEIPAGMQLPVLIYLFCLALSDIDTGGGGGGGAGSVLLYNNDPNAEGLAPTNLSQGALAYSLNPVLPTYTWNTITHVWQ